MIRLFEQNIYPVKDNSGHWVWVGLGLGVISDAISCTVEEERNGKYELTMEYPINGKRYSDLQINRTLVVKPNPDADPQGFRIYQVSKSIERVITVKAEHISYELSHIPVLPLRADSCANAMVALFDEANHAESREPYCQFEGWTDKEASYSDGSTGKVVTKDFQGRALEFSWIVTAVETTSIDISWTLKGVGTLTGYTNGWVMCGPINVTVGSRKILENLWPQGSRHQLYKDTVVSTGNANISFVSGTTSVPVKVEAYLYYDHPNDSTSKNGLVTGTGAITPASSSGSYDSGVGVFEVSAPVSLRSALGGQEGSVLDIYDGEFEWDNLTVKLHAHRGADRGITIRYGKNLTSLEQEETIAQTFTGIAPYWKGTEPETNAIVIVTLKGVTVDGSAISGYDPAPAYEEQGRPTHPEGSAVIRSVNASNYPYQRTLPYDLTDIFSKLTTNNTDSTRTQAEAFWDKVPTPEMLMEVGIAWVESTELGVPEVNLNVSFVALWQTEDYKATAPRDEVRLCDTVHVIFEELGVSADAKVVKTKFDVLTERYESMDLSTTGKLTASLASTIAAQARSIDDVVDETQNYVAAALSEATDRITGASGGYIKFLQDESGNPYEMVISNGQDNYMRFNKEGIGFSTNGFDSDSFNSAWTIDGTFNAQYINAFVFNSNKIYSGQLKSTNYDPTVKTGMMIDMDDGTIYAPKFKIETSNFDGFGGGNLLLRSRLMPLAKNDGDNWYGNAGFTVLEDTSFNYAYINATDYVDQDNIKRIQAPSVPYSRVSTETYLTFSAEVKASNAASLGDAFRAALRINMCSDKQFVWGADGTLLYYYTSDVTATIKAAAPNTWIRISITTPLFGDETAWTKNKSSATWSDIQYVVPWFHITRNGEVSVRKMKLEVGTIATDWSPASEDASESLEDYKTLVANTYATTTWADNRIASYVGSHAVENDEAYQLWKSNLDTDVANASSWVAQAESKITAVITSNKTISDLSSNVETIRQWINFDATDFLTIGLSSSDFYTQVTNEAFNVRKKGDEQAIASFGSEGMNVPRINIKTDTDEAGVLSMAPLMLSRLDNGWKISRAE